MDVNSTRGLTHVPICAWAIERTRPAASVIGVKRAVHGIPLKDPQTTRRRLALLSLIRIVRALHTPSSRWSVHTSASDGAFKVLVRDFLRQLPRFPTAICICEERGEFRPF